MKPTSILFALALLLAACTADSADAPQPTAITQQPTAITFGAYVEQTRAGLPVTDYTALTTGGFGVFAYYTGAASYASTNSPNFMYNQKVAWDDGAWTYTPLKYWPNDNRPADNDGATGSVDHSYVSFFAYAPQTGNGIALLTTNTTADDPKVGYTAATYTRDDDNSWGTDLVWGTDASGLPLTDRYRTQDPNTVKFTFRHALTRLGFEVKANYDDGTDDLSNRKILISSVTVTTNALRNSGTLNLNNTTALVPRWESLGTAFSGSYDDDDLNTDLPYTALQPVGIPNSGSDDYGITAAPRRAGVKSVGAQFAALPQGVTTTAKPLLTIGSDNYFYTLVPDFANATADVTVDITYHVITLDADHPYGFSDQTNTCTATTKLSALAAGKQYTLLLSLGLTSVKLDAEAANWE